jgi:ubiquitin carboxyl-terminal hydrolase 14
MCDDEHVHPVTTEDVLKLSGGGDWHTAYVLLYGPKVLVVGEGEVTGGGVGGVAESEKMCD